MASFLVSAGLALLVSTSAAAQPPNPFGIDLGWLIGREVRVIDVRGVERRGCLAVAGSGELRLMGPAGEVVVPYAEIKRLDRRGDSIKEGLILGMLWPIVGVALGAGQGFDSEAEAWAALPVGIAMIGLMGAGIDAMHNGWTTLDRSKRSAPSAVHILLARGGLRVAYVKRF